MVITKVPVAGMAASWSRSRVVCGPACQACRMGAGVVASAIEGTASNITPGASTTRSQ